MDHQVILSMLLIVSCSGVSVQGDDGDSPSFSITCPYGFITLPKSQSCYKLIKERLNYDDAYRACIKVAQYARLVAVESLHEHNSIKKYLEDDKSLMQDPCQGIFWTAGQRADIGDCNSKFYWMKRNYTNPVSNTFPELVTFNGWAVGEPNCQPNSLGCINYLGDHAYGWNDQGCHYKMCAICEAPPSSIAPVWGMDPF